MPVETPDASAWEAGTTEGLARGESSEPARPDLEFDAPAPQLADLIVDLLPFGRSLSESAVAQLLGPLEGLASSMPELYGPLGLLAASLTLGVAVLAVDVSLRARRSDEAEGDEAGFAGYPGLSGESIR